MSLWLLRCVFWHGRQPHLGRSDLEWALLPMVWLQSEALRNATRAVISATVLSIVFVSHCVPTFKVIYRRDLMCLVWFMPHAMSAWRRITGMDTRCSATHIIPIQYRTRPSSEPPNWVRAHPPYIMFALNVAFFVGVFLLGRCKWELLDECSNLRALMLRFDLEQTL